ncbi:MAG: hypothetical protein JKY70_17495 [Mucilaginibacter sp.]|nr:hypothetical protein [Mucilaginibacter sp.]
MRPSSLLALLGFFILIVGTFCPLLRAFHVTNFTLYQANRPFGITLLLVGVIGILCTVLNQTKVIRIAAWVAVVLVVVLYAGVIFKVKSMFGSLPFKGVSAFLERQIKFKWGMYTLFAGAILSLIGALSTKKPLNIQQVAQ